METNLSALTVRVGSGELEVAAIKAILGDTSEDVLIDLCCGEVAALRHVRFLSSVHVDITDLPNRPRSLSFVKTDVLGGHPIFNSKYGIVTCLDGIEHLTKPDGHRLIERMESLAPVCLIFTPLGDMWLGEEGNQDPMVHKSGWMPADFCEHQGWTTLAFPNWHLGWKFGGLFAWRGGDNQKISERLSVIP